MRHNRKEVIERTIQEFKRLDHLVADLTNREWNTLLPRPESKDPWTVKDGLAHITHWKANAARTARRQRRPADERGLDANQVNHLIYQRWHNRPPKEVLAWHRQVQKDVLAALHEAPEEYFTGREHGPDWPGDLDGHSAFHRIKDIERVLNKKDK
jgi:hypothetical protein